MDKIACPHCKRKLHNINAWHYCKEVAIDDLFVDKSDEIVLAFDAVLQQVETWEGVEISATKNCVVFVKNKTFLVVKPANKWLEIKFYSNSIIEDDDLHKCHIWNSKYEGIVRLTNEQDLKPKFMQYIKKSYQIS
jgi:Domain of unknown function (DUF5655)